MQLSSLDNKLITLRVLFVHLLYYSINLCQFLNFSVIFVLLAYIIQFLIIYIRLLHKNTTISYNYILPLYNDFSFFFYSLLSFFVLSGYWLQGKKISYLYRILQADSKCERSPSPIFFVTFNKCFCRIYYITVETRWKQSTRIKLPLKSPDQVSAWSLNETDFAPFVSATKLYLVSNRDKWLTVVAASVYSLIGFPIKRDLRLPIDFDAAIADDALDRRCQWTFLPSIERRKVPSKHEKERWAEAERAGEVNRAQS